jgi:hypothetical protein
MIKTTADLPYEPPAILVLGPVTELTLGNLPTGEPTDGSATYYEPSDWRLKRDVRRLADPLENIRRLERQGS